MSKPLAVLDVPQSDASEQDLRLLQLPRSPHTPPTSSGGRARCEARLPRLTSPDAGYERGTALAAVLLLLQRYTQQATLHLDLYAAGHEAVGLDYMLDLEQSCAAVARDLSGWLSSREASSHALLRPSNVALHWGDLPTDGGHELALALDCDGDGWRIQLAYDTTRLEAATASDLLESLGHVFEQARRRPESPLRTLRVLTERQRGELTAATVGDRRDVDPPCVPAQIRATCLRQPEATAARFGQESLTYAELEKRSDRLARTLLEQGVTRGAVVAVSLAPSLDVVVALLAVLRIGAIYCPLDPGHPESLVRGILGEARPRLLLTHSVLHAQRKLELPTLCLDEAWPSCAASTELPELALEASDPAYLLYTSGTTGKPKGVLATHGNLAHYVCAAREKYGFGPRDVFCSLARYTFSISLFELVSPLACGASLALVSRDEVLAPDRLAQLLQQVTVVHAGPSLLGSLFRYLESTPGAPRSFPRVRHVSSGGDLVAPHVMEGMKRAFPEAEVYVIYGCTEISCMGCTYPVSRNETAERSYVGGPFPDVAIRVTDPDGEQLPFGVAGEICFSGKGVVSGYLERPELNQEKFVCWEGARFYRTGDIGRLHRNGQLEILGRRDFQVQVRGIRVELLGIENTVRSLGLASQCAVVLQRIDEHDQRLVAFVVEPREDVSRLREELAKHLPDYMIPQNFVVLEAMPLNVNGKLDRRRLQELPWQANGQPSSSPPPATALERTIADAFARTLGVAQVGLDDDFFALGGHSLLAVVLLAELENSLGTKLSPGALFEHSTVRALSERAQSSLEQGARPVLLSQRADLPPLFLLLGVHLYRELARELEGQYSVYGVYAGRELLLFDAEGAGFTVEELAREYVEIIRAQQPTGPYRLAGMSFGGIVAYEVAQQLRDQGDEVVFLGLLDAVLPDWGWSRQRGRLQRLLALPTDEALSYAVRGLGEQLKSRMTRMGAVAARFARFAGDPQLGELENQREAVYRRAARDYRLRMRPFWGPATLITAGKRLQEELLEDRACGFRPYVDQLEVHSVNAQHLELLEAPYVADVAQLLLRGLSRQRDARPRSTQSMLPSLMHP